MPSGFCGGGGTVQDYLSLLVGSFHFVIAHLTSRVLNRGVHLPHEGAHFGVQFGCQKYPRQSLAYGQWPYDVDLSSLKVFALAIQCTLPVNFPWEK
jgi:hypothetical protein